MYTHVYIAVVAWPRALKAGPGLAAPSMLDYHRLGTLPAKHHIALYRDHPDNDGCPVYYEHCLTRKGFDGGYSILYRQHNPGAETALEPAEGYDTFEPVDPHGTRLHRHHFATGDGAGDGPLWKSLRWLLGNDDVHVGVSRPTDPDSGLVQDGDGDLLYFFHEGAGRVESEVGTLEFRRQDYVWVPKGLVHRIVLDGVEPRPHVLVMEARPALVVPDNFLNPVGQLKMDAPYSHRDLRRPERLSEPDGEGGARVLNKRGEKYTWRTLPHHPFDAVGFDGTVYPIAFNIKDYQPKTGLVHLPPPIHTTFLGAGGSFVVCSFVPRKVDYHDDAIPCPYPHSSVDCDEILFYVEGDFTSRKGVGPGSISLHPAGIPHAPQPGRYEKSMGTEATNELAVMVDTFRPLQLSKNAVACEDPDYHKSWAEGGRDAGDTYVD